MQVIFPAKFETAVKGVLVKIGFADTRTVSI
jgi:hypothetical protein